MTHLTPPTKPTPGELANDRRGPLSEYWDRPTGEYTWEEKYSEAGCYT
jgi:hypothetical protein